MSTHPITEAMRQVTIQAMRKKGMSKTQLAEHLGLGKAWATKFLTGTLRTIREETMFDLQDLLGVQYFKIERAMGERTPLASKIAASVDCDPAFAKVAVALHDALTEARGAFTPRFVPTAEMSALGAKIVAIVEQNPGKPGKVARLVLELLA